METNAGLNTEFSYYVGDYIVDPDGDYLDFYLASSSDQTALRDVGLDFYPEKRIIAGAPYVDTTVPVVKISAKDVHGAVASMYVTIFIKNYMPSRRTDVPVYSDVTVTQG